MAIGLADVAAGFGESLQPTFNRDAQRFQADRAFGLQKEGLDLEKQKVKQGETKIISEALGKLTDTVTADTTRLIEQAGAIAAAPPTPRRDAALGQIRQTILQSQSDLLKAYAAYNLPAPASISATSALTKLESALAGAMSPEETGTVAGQAEAAKMKANPQPLSPEGKLAADVEGGFAPQAALDKALERAPREVVNVRLPSGQSQAFRLNDPALDRALAQGGTVFSEQLQPVSSSDVGKAKDAVVRFGRIEQALDAYEAALKTVEPGLAGKAAASVGLSGPQMSSLQTAYTNIILEAKDLFTLGALSGPDLALIQKLLSPPTDPRRGNESLVAQIGQVRQKVTTARETAVGTFLNPPVGGGGQQQPTSQPAAPQAAAPAAKAGESNLPAGLPAGSRQVGTKDGKPVYETPDGKRFKVE